MKKNLITTLVLLTLSLTFLFSQNALAGTWATCSIDQVGRDYGHSIVILTHTGGVFTNKRFELNPNNKDPMLAVALTAQSMGKNVLVLIDDTDPQLINRIRILND